MTVALKGHYVNEGRKFVLLNGDPFNSAPAGNIPQVEMWLAVHGGSCERGVGHGATGRFVSMGFSVCRPNRPV